MSPSGYPLTIAEWRRGTKLEDAREIWRGEPKDVVAAGMAYWDKGTRYKARAVAVLFLSLFLLLFLFLFEIFTRKL